MNKKRAIVIAAFGDRATQVTRLVHNIRRFVDYPIHVVTTEDSNAGFMVTDSLEEDMGNGMYVFSLTQKVKIEYVTRLWPAHEPRSGVRNSNYFKIKWAVAESLKRRHEQYDSLLLLDDDMLIVDENFVAGFDIAERFGAALPLNPRVYTWANMLGVDVTPKDVDDLQGWGVPTHSPAVNFSPFFVSSKHDQARNFLVALQSELRDNVCRGTLAVTKASWQTGFTPVYLPQQFCVCGAEAEYIKGYTQQLRGQQIPISPIMLHLGHEETQRVFKDDIERYS